MRFTISLLSAILISASAFPCCGAGTAKQNEGEGQKPAPASAMPAAVRRALAEYNTVTPKLPKSRNDRRPPLTDREKESIKALLPVFQREFAHRVDATGGRIPEVHAKATNELLSMDDRVVGVLFDLRQNGTSNQRAAVSQLLPLFGPRTIPEALVRLKKDRSSDLKTFFGNTGLAGNAAILSLLKDKDPAIVTLGVGTMHDSNLVITADGARLLLKVALTHPKAETRVQAIEMLDAGHLISPAERTTTTRDVLTFINKKDGSALVRQAAEKALIRFQARRPGF